MITERKYKGFNCFALLLFLLPLVLQAQINNKEERGAFWGFDFGWTGPNASKSVESTLKSSSFGIPVFIDGWLFDTHHTYPEIEEKHFNLRAVTGGYRFNQLFGSRLFYAMGGKFKMIGHHDDKAGEAFLKIDYRERFVGAAADFHLLDNSFNLTIGPVVGIIHSEGYVGYNNSTTNEWGFTTTTTTPSHYSSVRSQSHTLPGFMVGGQLNFPARTSSFKFTIGMGGIKIFNTSDASAGPYTVSLQSPQAGTASQGLTVPATRISESVRFNLTFGFKVLIIDTQEL